MHPRNAMHSTRTYLVALVAVTALLAACGQPATSQHDAVTSADGLAAGVSIPEPGSKPVLTIKGAITESNSANGVELDVETLAEMPSTQADVYEPFVKEDVSFTGVLLDDLLEIVGMESGSGSIFMQALDDYSMELSIADFSEAGAMVAIEEDGKPIKIRHGGPARIVFLTDGKIAANTDMWIWSVNRMKVLP